MKHIIAIIVFSLSIHLVTSAQELKVTLSPDQRKVNIDTRAGVSSIVFESSIKGLTISSNFGDECIVSSDGKIFFRVLPDDREYVKEYGYPRRSFIINAPNCSEYILETPEILPNTVIFYSVTLQDKFTMGISAEYIISKSSKYGVRVSGGKRFGGYISYKWDSYRPSGNNIDEICTDGDVTNAKYLGYIRRSIMTGARLGLLHKNTNELKPTLYLLVGGGYGEYGRQWKNPTQLEGNIYFFSDYMKGFDGELTLQATFFDLLTISAGTDMLIVKGKISIDYMFGLGINLNLTNMRKKKL